jgi:hypothetical protein
MGPGVRRDDEEKSARMSRYSHSNDRWIRHDAQLWMCNDIKRYLKPGTDPADVIPVLRRQRDREDAAFAAEIAKGYP